MTWQTVPPSNAQASGFARLIAFENCNRFCPILGIPVKYFPEADETMKPVQYAALFSDLVKHTRFALKQLDINDANSLQGF